MRIQTYHNKIRLHRTGLRRGIATALAFGMLLPMAPASFAAEQRYPVLVEHYDGTTGAVDDSPEFPDIEIQGNFVRDEFGFLTGYLELALRVKTPADPASFTTFQSLSVALEYDSDILTPVTWDASDPTQDAEVSLSETYTSIDTQKNSKIDTAAAEGWYGSVSVIDLQGTTTNVDKNLLYFTVKSVEDISFEKEMTTLGVIRFKIKDGLKDQITIQKKQGSTEYQVYYAGTAVNDMVALQKEAGASVQMVDFAEDDTISKSHPAVNMALNYATGMNASNYTSQYYYVPDYDATDPTTFDASGTVKVSSVTYTVTKPNTKNGLVLAADPNKADSDQDKYSYLSNLLPSSRITFPLVSELSFTDNGSGLDGLTTIVYVDWDNTLLGTQIVPQKADVRTLVSDYVAENFIFHDDNGNDLRYPSKLSLTRLDNYRGKYVATAPAGEDATDPTNSADVQALAGKYPLTNKLDYVFYKRPMESTAGLSDKPDPTDTTKYPNGETDATYITDLAAWQKKVDSGAYPNTWVQKSTSGTADDGSSTTSASYDAYHPFAYGWALCTADNYQDTWTTLGTTGELSSYEIDANGVAAVTYDGDQDFEFADLEKGFASGQSTVFLKAVYEPGEDLTSEQYRLYTSPAYDKLNAGSAENGGAYSVTVNYERASTSVYYHADGTSDNYLRGVERMREPYVRQQTTTDLKWEEDSALSVSHNLTNATSEEAYDLNNKTTYTKVEVSNSEIVNISLTLSARQNKVDYFLIEGYNNNFVSGGQRSAGNNSFKDADFTVDNYNYYVAGESDETDSYFDVVNYDDRNGSHGFVLYGTLNNLMKKASQYNDGTIDSTEYMRYISYTALKDANLRLDSAGTEPSALNQSTFREKVKAAAAAAAAHRSTTTSNDYWDATLDCAQLTYHQLQYYILYDNLLSRADADRQTINWCHLHSTCAAATSGKPTTWAGLMTAASGNASDQDAISLLTAGEIENFFHLRTDGSGTAFTSATDFQTAVVTAVAAWTSAGVAASSLTWDQVQYAIEKGTTSTNANTYGADHYWWYEGGTKPTTYGEVLTAAAAVNDSTSKSYGRMAAINTLEDAFNKVGSGGSRTDWVTLTEFFATDATDGTLDNTTFAALANKLVTAVDTLGAGADWGDIQYYILHGTAPNHPADDSEIAGYFWHYGAQKVTDVATMITAAKAQNAAWSAFTLDDLYNVNYDLHFRSGFDGTKYTAADFADFKAAVLAYVADSNSKASDWEHFQNYLIHHTCSTSSALLRIESGYYWWKGGNTATPVDMTLSSSQAEDRADDMAQAISTAAFLSAYNGNTVAWDNLTETVLENGRLVNGYDETNDQTFADMTKFISADISTVTAVAEQLIKNKVGTTINFASIPTLTWEEIQDAFLVNSVADYWWKTDDNKPSAANDPWDDFATLVSMIKDVADALNNVGDATPEADALRAWLTPAIAKNIGLVGFDGVNPPTQDDLDSCFWEYLDYNSAGCYDNGDFEITWCQIMDIMVINFGGWLDDAQTAHDMIIDYGYEDPTNSDSSNYWGSASGASLAPARMSMRKAAVPSPVETTETQISDDGLTVTTITTVKTWNSEVEDWDTLITTVAATTVTTGETTIIVTTKTVTNTYYDTDTWELVTTSETFTTTEVLSADTDPVTEEPQETEEPEPTETPAETTEPETTDPVESQPVQEDQTPKTDETTDGQKETDDTQASSGSDVSDTKTDTTEDKEQGTTDEKTEDRSDETESTDVDDTKDTVRDQSQAETTEETEQEIKEAEEDIIGSAVTAKTGFSSAADRLLRSLGYLWAKAVPTPTARYGPGNSPGSPPGILVTWLDRLSYGTGRMFV